jgi:hypothetical protein
MARASWPELVPFDPESREVPEFPLQVLPSCLATYTQSIAGHYLAPPDLPATLLIGVVSGAVAGAVRLQIDADWDEPANLYLLCILPPSQHKSPIMKLATAPAERVEQRRVQSWRQEDTLRSTARKHLQAELHAMKRRGSSPDYQAKLAEIEALAARPRPAVMCDDATSEYLVSALEHGPILMASAEGRPFELITGLYRKSGEDGADVYLKAWSEDPIRSGRVSRPEVYIPSPNLTIALAVQPAIIEKLVPREDLRGRGLIARFLCSYPRTQVGFRQWDASKPIDSAIRAEYGALIERLYSMPRATEEAGARYVRLEPDAHTAFARFRQEVENDQRDGRALADWQDFAGKLAGQCARLALVLHMAEHGTDGVDRALRADTMERAIVLARYFLIHTTTTWSRAAKEPRAARLVQWLKRTKRQSVTTRELHRNNQRHFQSAAEVRKAAIELVDRGYLMRVEHHADSWLVSPRVYEEVDKGE